MTTSESFRNPPNGGTAAPAGPPPSGSGSQEGASLNPGLVIALFLANFGLWTATMTPLIVTLPLKASAVDPDPKTQALTLSLVLLIGALLNAIGMTVVAIAPSAGLVIIGWAIAQIGLNSMMSVLIALIPDQVPAARRGMMSAVFGIAQGLASMAGTGLAFALSRSSLQLAIIVPSLIALVCMCVAVFTIHDRRLAPADRPPFGFREFITSFWVNPFREKDFGLAWWSRFAMFMAVSMVLNYQLFFLVQQVGMSNAQATALIPIATAAQTVCVIVVSPVVGALSDRLRSRKLFVIVSALILACGLGLAAFATTVPHFLMAMALVGLGQGAYLAIDLALVTDILPEREEAAAKNMGVFNLANVIPQSLAPAIAPAFLVLPVVSITGIAGQNYTALFIGGAVFALISGLIITRVRGVR